MHNRLRTGRSAVQVWFAESLNEILYCLTLLCSTKGWKGALDVPKLVDLYMDKKLKLDEFITHNFPLDQINMAFELFKSGER